MSSDRVIATVASVCVCVCVTACTSRKQLQQVPLSLVELPPCPLTSQNHLKHTNDGISVLWQEITNSSSCSHLKPQLFFPLLHLLLLLLLFHSSPDGHTHARQRQPTKNKFNREREREYLYFLCSMLTARFRLLTRRLVLYDLQAAWITHAAFTCSVDA